MKVQRQQTEHNRPGWRGFTLLEILIVLLLASFVFQGLAQITSTLLRGWDRSAKKLGDQSVAFNAVDRIADEIAGAVPAYIAGNESEGQISLFSGRRDEMTFLRPAIGFETTFDLNIVTYRLEPLSEGVAIIRLSRPYAVTDPQSEDTQLTRTVLAEFSGTLSFSYSNDGFQFADDWQGQPLQPRAVRMQITINSADEGVFSKTAFPLAEADSTCIGPDPTPECLTMLDLAS